MEVSLGREMEALSVPEGLSRKSWIKAAASFRGLNGAPQRSVFPELVVVNLFGKRIFADVIKLKISRWINWVGPKSHNTSHSKRQKGRRQRGGCCEDEAEV